jgi:hypothetical protein
MPASRCFQSFRSPARTVVRMIRANALSRARSVRRLRRLQRREPPGSTRPSCQQPMQPSVRLRRALRRGRMICVGTGTTNAWRTCRAGGLILSLRSPNGGLGSPTLEAAPGAVHFRQQSSSCESWEEENTRSSEPALGIEFWEENSFCARRVNEPISVRLPYLENRHLYLWRGILDNKTKQCKKKILVRLNLQGSCRVL